MQAIGVLCRTDPCGPWWHLLRGRESRPPSLILAFSRHLSYEDLLSNLGMEKPKWVLSPSEKMGKLVAHPTLLFLVREHSWVWDFLLARSCVGLGQGWGGCDADQVKLFFLPFLCGFLHVFTTLRAIIP